MFCLCYRYGAVFYNRNYMPKRLIHFRNSAAMYLKSWSDDRDSIYVYGQWTECWQGMSKLIVISQADMLVCKICVVSVFYLYHSLTGQGLLTCVIAKKKTAVFRASVAYNDAMRMFFCISHLRLYRLGCYCQSSDCQHECCLVSGRDKKPSG